VIYDLEGGAHEHRSQSQEGTTALQCPAASPSSAVDLDRASAAGRSLSGTGDQCGRAVGLGEAGARGHAQGAGVADAPGTGTHPEPETGAVAGTPGLTAEGKDGQTGEATDQAPRAENAAADQVDHARGAGGFRDERS